MIKVPLLSWPQKVEEAIRVHDRIADLLAEVEASAMVGHTAALMIIADARGAVPGISDEDFVGATAEALRRLLKERQ